MKDKTQSILLSEIVAGLAHNINTPLNLILGYAQQMQTKGNNPDFLQKILDAGFKIDEIISQTMHALQLRQDFSLKKIDLADLIKSELILLYDDLRIKRSIKIEADGIVSCPLLYTYPAIVTTLLELVIYQLKEQAPLNLHLALESKDSSVILVLKYDHEPTLLDRELYLPPSSELCASLGLKAQQDLYRIEKHESSIYLEFYGYNG